MLLPVLLSGVKGPVGDTGETGVQGDTGLVHLGQLVCLLFINETTLTLIYFHLFTPLNAANCETEFHLGI